MIQVKELILSDLTRKGTGKDGFSPVRTILEVYTRDGDLVAYHDSQGNYSLEDLVSFGKRCLANPNQSIEQVFASWEKELTVSGAHSISRLVA